MHPSVCFQKAVGSPYPSWTNVQFLSLIDNIVDFRGRTPKKLGMDWSEEKTDYLALSALNVKTGYIDFSADPHYGDEELYEKWMSGNELRKGQVLFTTEAPMGNVAQVPDDRPYILSQRTIAFDVDENKIDEGFLAYLLLSPKVQIALSKLATGGTATGISQKSLAKLNVTISSSLEEQQKIADFLSSVDDVISTSEEEVANLETQKKAVMKKIFSQEVRFKRADGSDFPEWEETTIGDMGEMHGGLSGKTKDDFGHGNSSFITYMNVYKNPFASPDLLEKVDVKPNEKQYMIHYGDVMFTQSSETVEEVGLSSVWMYHTEPYMNSFCMVLRPNDLTHLIPEFAGYLFRSDDVRKQIILQGQGVTRVNLAPSRLVDVRFEYPSAVEEQRFIAGFLSEFDEAILAAQKELELWKELKKGLLQQMFV